MSGWVYDPELNDLVPFEEYVKRVREKEKKERIIDLKEAIKDVLLNELEIYIDVKTGKAEVREKPTSKT